jgi:iron(III) transport system permease protein
VLSSPPLIAGVLNSIKVGVIGALALVVISLFTAVAVHGIRPTHFLAGWMDALTRLPIALPAVVLGIGLLWAYFLLPLPIYGTLAILIIAAITKFLPIIYSSVSASYLQLGHELREAGMVAGARTGRLVMEVDVPILAGPLLAAFFYALILASHEATASVMLYSPESITLPILLWITLENAGAPTTAAVMALVSMALTGVLMLLGAAVGRFFRPRWSAKAVEGGAKLTFE